MRTTVIALCLLAALAAQAEWRLVTRPISAANALAGQRAGCQAAVNRVQKAVTAEAHAYADARRTMCQYFSLPENMREGRPQAINDSMQRKWVDARKERDAAYAAARGCDASRVKRPEVTNYTPGAVDAMIACYARHHLSGDRPSGGNIEACDHLAEELECANIRVVEESKPELEEEVVVNVPDDLSPECRDAYLQLKTAEREYERARKRERQLAPNFAVAGPRGTAIYNAARADVRRAGEKKTEADKKLRACKALDAGDEAQPGTAGERPAQGERPCTADERAAFAQMTGTFHSYRMNITVGGSCEQATGTWKVTEWCEGVDETYNSSVARVEGTFTGRMEGGSLRVSYQSPPSPHNSAGTKGTGSCSANGDGSFSCSGFGCENKFKK